MSDCIKNHGFKYNANIQLINQKQIKMEQKKWSAGAWKKTTAKGEVINFTINDVKYSMWVNAYKTEDKQPDYKIYVNDFKPKEDTEGLPF